MADVTMPQLGETVTEGTITRWFKQVGDEIALDEALFEVSTDKVDTEVPSPVAGVLAEILANEGDVVEVGQILARVGDDAGEAPSTEPASRRRKPRRKPWSRPRPSLRRKPWSRPPPEPAQESLRLEPPPAAPEPAPREPLSRSIAAASQPEDSPGRQGTPGWRG